MRFVLAPLVLFAALFVAAALPPAAEAKLCVSIDAVRSVRAGAVVTVRVTGLLPTAWVGTRPVELEPTPMPQGRRLVMVGPRSERREAILRRTQRPEVVVARIRLDRAGTWTLSVAGWEYAPRACAGRVRILVR